MRHALVLVIVAALAHGRAASTCLLDIAGSCDLVVHGTVVELRGTNVVLEVRRAWKAPQPPEIVVVDPFAARRCMESPPRFAVGEEVVLFLNAPENGVRSIREAAEGKVAIPEGKRDEILAAVDRLVAIAALDEDSRNRAMLDLATSKDAILRREAHRHVSTRIRGGYRAELLPLLEDADPETRRAALEALRRFKAPELVERFIALSRDPDPGVVQSASLALSPYDTDATVDALIALTRHENPHVRSRALIDLGNSRKPRARATLLGFLDDPDPAVRKLACGRLVAWLRERRHAEATARIGRVLVEDPSEEVRAEAAGLAFEAQDPILIAPLLHALDGATPGGALEAAALRSLLWFQIYGGDAAKRDVEAQIGLVRRSVRRGTGGTAAIEILYGAGDLATVREASKNHPDPEVRAVAQSYAARRSR